MGRRLFSWRIFVLFRVGAWLFLILFAIFVGQGLNALIYLVPFGILSVGYYFWPLRAASKESYAYRYWNGLPYVGEYAIMRGYLFLRVKPRVDYTYLKPRRFEKLGEEVLIVWIQVASTEI